MKRNLCGVLCVVALAVSACGSSSAGTSSPVDTSGLILTAEIDPGTSSVILPADRFQMTEHEQRILRSAGTAAYAQCVRDKTGFQWEATRAPKNPDPSTNMWYELGPWTRSMADQYGFAMPAPRADLVANGVLPPPEDYELYQSDYANASVTQGDLDRIGNVCDQDPEAARFDVHKLGLTGGPEALALSQLSDEVFADERVQDVIEELKVCGREQGLMITDIEGEGGTFPIAVKGADPLTINEEQIALANKYVTCMEQTDAVKRVTDVWAEKQAPIIEEYAREFVAQRETIDDALAKAETYIAQHPEVFYEYKYERNY